MALLLNRKYSTKAEILFDKWERNAIIVHALNITINKGPSGVFFNFKQAKNNQFNKLNV